MAKHRLQPQPAKGATVARGALVAGAVTIGTLAAPAATVLAAPAPVPNPAAPGVKAKPGVKPVKRAAPRPSLIAGRAIAPKAGIVGAGIAPGAAKAKAVQAALSRVGMPYSYGSAGPTAFDCSGLVKWSMAQAGLNVPRDSWGQLGGGRPVSLSQLQPGDVVIYNGGSHAALYIGAGKVVQSVNYGIPVKVSPLNEMSVYAARRY